jgi:6-phosphogluconolactonase/glucosamine-6-phosphate isomerase/deaminase
MIKQIKLLSIPDLSVQILCYLDNHFSQNPIAPIYVMVSGGESCKQLFEGLADLDFPFSKFRFILTDERLTDINSATNKFAIQQASRGAVSPLIPSKSESIRQQHISLIGFGLDGHVASIFSDSPRSSALLSVTSRDVFKVYAPHSAEHKNRITFNLAALFPSEMCVILVSSPQKLEFLQNHERFEGTPIAQFIDGCRVRGVGLQYLALY